ncbi:MAG: AI-2E family transporter [Crocinitomicaceae bacterium]
MNSLKLTNTLLLIIALPVVFYILHILSFIFVPLLSSMFIALFFVPMMRRMKRRGFPKFVSVGVSVILMILFGTALYFLIDKSSEEILSTKDEFLAKAELKIAAPVKVIYEYFGIKETVGQSPDEINFKKEMAMLFAQPLINSAGKIISQLLMTLFFVILWLSESINFERILNSTILKQKYSSVKTFRRIEKDTIKFIRVKILVSLGTGIGTALACYLFGVSFPIFWGIFAFSINFIQMIGSFVTVILCSIFAFVDLDPTGNLLFFILIITAVQVIFGSIIEPIYMGRSFTINIITVLVMLLFWGFIWGVPGMIMSIPLTVFLKIIMDQFERTKIIAKLIE